MITALCRGAVDGIGSDSGAIFSVKSNSQFNIENGNPIIDQHQHVGCAYAAYQLIMQWLNASLKPECIANVCYRVVHGGNYFHTPVLVNKSVLEKLESLIPLAPLHQPQGLAAIKTFMKQYSGAQHIACFDTAFHRTMPKVSQFFAIPRSLHEQGIQPYGFHGLSYQYVAQKVAELNKGKIPRRVVIAHLGSGASMCALLEGESIATSMSFSPLDGLPMATRSGAIDASVVLYMIEHLNLSAKEVSDILNKESGLLGLSGLSGDVRVLMASDSEEATFALDYFIYRISRELGAMTATLQGLDALIFTAGIGANNDVIRDKVCEKFEWLGISLSAQANQLHENIISSASSRIKVFSIKTDEELMMAQWVFDNSGVNFTANIK